MGGQGDDGGGGSAAHFGRRRRRRTPPPRLVGKWLWGLRGIAALLLCMKEKAPPPIVFFPPLFCVPFRCISSVRQRTSGERKVFQEQELNGISCPISKRPKEKGKRLHTNQPYFCIFVAFRSSESFALESFVSGKKRTEKKRSAKVWERKRAKF